MAQDAKNGIFHNIFKREFLLWEYGLPILKVLLWLKAACLFLTFYFIRTYKEKEFYYYRNLGIRDTILWSLTLGCDGLLFTLFLTLGYHVRP